MIAWTSAWLTLRPVWVRRLLAALASCSFILAAYMVQPALLMILPALFVVAMLGGICSAALEIRKDRRLARQVEQLRELEAWLGESADQLDPQTASELDDYRRQIASPLVMGTCGCPGLAACVHEMGAAS